MIWYMIYDMIWYAWAGFCLRSQPHKEKIHTGPYRHSQPQFISVPSASKANQIRPVTEWQTRNPKADCNIGGWILIRVGHSTCWERPMQRECFGSYFPKSCEYVWMTFVLQHFFNFFLTTTQTSAQTWPWLHLLSPNTKSFPLSSDASPRLNARSSFTPSSLKIDVCNICRFKVLICYMDCPTLPEFWAKTADSRRQSG